MQVSTNHGGTRELADTVGLNPDVSFTFRHFQTISNELVPPRLLVCPADRQRVPNADFAGLRNGNVSYWINIAALFGQTDSPIAGDRNVRTSGRTEWTFVRFGPTDVVEFSPELHGHRGNVLFADAHVDVLDAASLRLAFASSNATDVTLSIPNPEMAPTGSNSDAAPDGRNSRGSSAEAPSMPSSVENASSTDDRAGAARNASRGNSNEVSLPDSLRRARPLVPGGDRRETVMVVTRLDGTVVTSSVPYQVTNSLADTGQRSTVALETTNPFIQFVQWLTQLSARGTYWLLFLLLLALIAFEIARRRSRRQRGRNTEGIDY